MGRVIVEMPIVEEDLALGPDGMGNPEPRAQVQLGRRMGIRLEAIIILVLFFRLTCRALWTFSGLGIVAITLIMSLPNGVTPRIEHIVPVKPVFMGLEIIQPEAYHQDHAAKLHLVLDKTSGRGGIDLYIVPVGLIPWPAVIVRIWFPVRTETKFRVRVVLHELGIPGQLVDVLIDDIKSRFHLVIRCHLAQHMGAQRVGVGMAEVRTPLASQGKQVENTLAVTILVRPALRGFVQPDRTHRVQFAKIPYIFIAHLVVRDTKTGQLDFIESLWTQGMGQLQVQEPGPDIFRNQS